MKQIASIIIMAAAAIAFAVDDGHTDSYARGRIDIPVMRNDAHTEHYLSRHNSRISRIRKNESRHYDIVFFGDSITHNWERSHEKHHKYGQAVWAEEFAGFNALNCGFGGDRVETCHWRAVNGELDGYTCDWFCVLIGTNNRQNTSEEISQGVKAFVETIKTKHPESRIALMTILPRNDIHPPKVTEDVIARVRGANPIIEEWAAKDPQITLLNLERFFMNDDGSLKSELFNDGLHPNPAGYRIWAHELKKVISAASPKPLLAGFHPDPSVCKGADGAYYLATSSFMWQPGLPIYRSEDFISWELAGHAVSDFSAVSNPDELQNLHDDDGVWAPGLRYHDGLYYVTYTFHGASSRNYISYAKEVSGPWSKPVHVKGADGGIDPSLFFDDDGKAYWLAERTAKEQQWRGHTEIYIAQINLATGEFLTEPKVLSCGVTEIRKNTEGPHLYKFNGEYFLLHAEGGTSFHHAETALKAKSVFGPYTAQRNNPLITRRDRDENSALQATGHADLVETGKPGEFYAVFLATRPLSDDHRVILGRETFACKARLEDGEIVFDGDILIPGRVVSEEEECVVSHGEAKYLVRRVRSFAFDESLETKTAGEALVVWRSARGHVRIERRKEGAFVYVSDRKGENERAFIPLEEGSSATFRFVCKDGMEVIAYVNGTELCKIDTSIFSQNGRNTRFNGLGIGRAK